MSEQVTKRILVVLGIVGVLVFFWYMVWFFWINEFKLSSDPGDWGVFGDFVGGLMNPIVAGAGLIFLVMTLKQNEKALGQAEKALEQSQKSLKQAELMIAQGQKVIEQNAKELADSRVELQKSAEAQEKLAAIEVRRSSIMDAQQTEEKLQPIMRRLAQNLIRNLDRRYTVTRAGVSKTVMVDWRDIIHRGDYSLSYRQAGDIVKILKENEVEILKLYELNQELHQSLEDAGRKYFGFSAEMEEVFISLNRILYYRTHDDKDRFSGTLYEYFHKGDANNPNVMFIESLLLHDIGRSQNYDFYIPFRTK